MTTKQVMLDTWNRGPLLRFWRSGKPRKIAGIGLFLEIGGIAWCGILALAFHGPALTHLLHPYLYNIGATALIAGDLLMMGAISYWCVMDTWRSMRAYIRDNK